MFVDSRIPPTPLFGTMAVGSIPLTPPSERLFNHKKIYLRTQHRVISVPNFIPPAPPIENYRLYARIYQSQIDQCVIIPTLETMKFLKIPLAPYNKFRRFSPRYNTEVGKVFWCQKRDWKPMLKFPVIPRQRVLMSAIDIKRREMEMDCISEQKEWNDSAKARHVTQLTEKWATEGRRIGLGDKIGGKIELLSRRIAEGMELVGGEANQMTETLRVQQLQMRVYYCNAIIRAVTKRKIGQVAALGLSTLSLELKYRFIRIMRQIIMSALPPKVCLAYPTAVEEKCHFLLNYVDDLKVYVPQAPLAELDGLLNQMRFVARQREIAAKAKRNEEE